MAERPMDTTTPIERVPIIEDELSRLAHIVDMLNQCEEEQRVRMVQYLINRFSLRGRVY